jgi:hypothetical protein
MCPDKQFLSVYFDGELPSPWKERMARHLAACSKCREKLEVYKKMSVSLNMDVEGGEFTEAEENSVIEAASGRVWERLDSRIKHEDRRLRRFFPARTQQVFVSVAAGAIAATAIICFILILSRGQNGKNSVPELTGAVGNFNSMVSGGYSLDPDIIPASDMNDVLRYLENDDTNIVIIKLPERKKFSRYGEPAFINAADYSRRTKK